MVLVAVQLSVLGLYLPPVLNMRSTTSAPDDHFTPGPDCCVSSSSFRRISGAGSSPRIVGARRTICIGNFRKSVDNLP